MAFEDVEAETTVDKYWNPEKISDSIEGNVMEFIDDQWGNKRIVLDLGDDENGEVITTTLPGHAHLQRFVNKLEVGDYVRVELAKMLEPKEEGRSPTRIYKVQKDPDRKITYE